MPLVKSKAMPADRAFAIAVQLLWNSLPCELCSITCVIVIKLILRSIFLVLHILNRDLNNTFAEYLSICFFTITNCQIVRSRSLTHRINYKFMCLPLIDNERARISAFIVKILVTMQLLGFTFVLLFSPCELSWAFHKSTLGKHIDW